jgi:F-type H+-transporting ATPase subunit delta
MNDSLITVRYARALFQLSEETKIQDSVKKDMEELLACSTDSPEFKFMLESPMVKGSEKSRLVDVIFKDKIQDLTLKFFHLLITNKREHFLPDVCRNFISEYKQKLGIKEASIITANALGEELRKQIFNYITSTFGIKIELEEKVDPSIIGGFILRIEDEQVNASIQGQLNKIKRELVNSL